jgi:hypothetical protein
VYLERAFPPQMRPKDRLPTACELGETSLMFQVHPTLDEQNMRYAAGVIEDVVTAASM